MNAASWMSYPTTSLATPNVIFSPELEDGAMHYDSPDGPTTDLFGPVHVPASRSRSQDNGKDLQMNDTCGRSGSGSSASAALQLSLESRLRQRFAADGGTLFRQTWKTKVTPAGWQFLAHTASVPRTSVSGCGSWPSPQATVGTNSTNWKATDGRMTPNKMGWAASLAGWPTPNLSDANNSRIPPEKAQEYSTRRLNRPNACSQLADTAQALVAAWPTPSAEKNTPQQREDFTPNLANVATWATPQSTDSHGSKAHGDGGQALHTMATWATPSSRDYKDSAGMAFQTTNPDGSERTRLDLLPRQVFGLTATGSPAETGKPGQLNPALSRWLMGYPVAWCQAAIRAYRTRRPRRKREVGG